MVTPKEIQEQREIIASLSLLAPSVLDFGVSFMAEDAAWWQEGVCLLNHLKVSVPCSSAVTMFPVVLSCMIASQMENEEWL